MLTPILMYHEVGEAGTGPDSPVASWTVAAVRFREHLAALSDAGYTGMSIENWLDWRNNASGGLKPVVITFDDGYRGNVENALPALLERGWSATFFVISGRMGCDEYANPDAWRDAAKLGMDIASHTASHPFLGVMNAKAVRAELLDSRLALEEATGGPVHGISWPNGDPPAGGTALARECGYVWTATSRAAFAGPSTSRLALPRLPVRTWHDPSGLLALIDTSSSHRMRLAVAYWAKRAARAALGRKRYAQLQTKVME